MVKPQPSLVWLSSVDIASMRSQLDLAARTLRAVLTGDLEVDEQYWDLTVRKVVSACVEAGPGQLSSSEALQLLFPLALILHEQRSGARFAQELEALRHRRDIWTSRALDPIRAHLSAEPPERSSDTDGAVNPAGLASGNGDDDVIADARELIEVLALDAPPLSDVSRLRGVLPAAASLWTLHRATLSPELRGAGDAWLMRALTLGHLPWPIALAEAIFLDEAVWSSQSLAAYTVGLTHPIQEEPTGLAASALINARLRSIRPRLFLRFPETRVVESIGTPDTSQLVRGVIDLVAEPLLRTAEVIDEELNRPNDRRPRKGAFQDIRELLSQVLDSLGYSFLGAGGEPAMFDPSLHISFQQVEQGAPVTVSRPGLRSDSDDVVSVKAQVSPAAVPNGYPKEAEEDK